jgi:Spy/CpxP family protein refolding chaperone
VNGSRGTVLAVSASLIVGCAIGLIGGVLFSRSIFALGVRASGEHRFHPGERLHYVEQRLHLTKDQSDRIEKIVDASRAQADSVRSLARQQILQVLTPEQRAQWERMDQHFFHHGGPPHGPDGPGDEPPPPPDQH